MFDIIYIKHVIMRTDTNKIMNTKTMKKALCLILVMSSITTWT